MPKWNIEENWVQPPKMSSLFSFLALCGNVYILFDSVYLSSSSSPFVVWYGDMKQGKRHSNY